MNAVLVNWQVIIHLHVNGMVDSTRIIFTDEDGCGVS